MIATGLDNPRQLSFTRGGDLLVAESGEGGAGPCLPGPEGGEVCFGTSGAITKVSARGKQTRLLRGLPSLAARDGSEATGPGDVVATGHRISVLIGLGADPARRAELPAAGQRMGTLVSTTKKSRSLRTIADLAAWEAANDWNNDPDSNPTGMLYDHGRYVVADAGGNTVVRVGRGGGIRLLATFADREVDAPPIPGLPPRVAMQAVPTSVAARGWDGAYYVSQLTGFPFPKGAANIYRIDPRTGQTTVYASGLTNVTDLAFSGRSLYAVQLSTEGLLNGPVGSVVKVEPRATSPEAHTVVAGELFAPYGIAIKRGSAYVTTGSVAKDAGQVIRIRL